MGTDGIPGRRHITNGEFSGTHFGYSLWFNTKVLSCLLIARFDLFSINRSCFFHFCFSTRERSRPCQASPESRTELRTYHDITLLNICKDSYYTYAPTAEHTFVNQYPRYVISLARLDRHKQCNTRSWREKLMLTIRRRHNL